MVVREFDVDAAGTRIFTRESGEGSPVVLLHGFPQTGRCWDRVARTLAERHRVLVPDLPGYGRSARPPGYDARTLAVTMAAYMEAAGAPRAAVVGHDWGGAVAFRLALDHADRVERLAVVNSPFRTIDYRRAWHMLFFSLPVVPEVAFTLAGDLIVSWSLRAASADPAAFEPSAIEEYRAAYRSLERQRSAFAYYRTATRRALLRALPLPFPRRGGPSERRKIEVPTLIVWGARDPVLPPSLLDGIERDIPDVRIELIQDAGHFVPEEAPERVAGLLEAFLTPA